MAEEGDKKNEFRVSGEDLLKRVKDLIREGNVRRIIIKDEQGKTYLEIPLTLGVVGVVLAPVLAAIGALAALAGNFTIEIVKRDEKGGERARRSRNPSRSPRCCRPSPSRCIGPGWTAPGTRPSPAARPRWRRGWAGGSPPGTATSRGGPWRCSPLARSPAGDCASCRAGAPRSFPKAARTPAWRCFWRKPAAAPGSP